MTALRPSRRSALARPRHPSKAERGPLGPSPDQTPRSPPAVQQGGDANARESSQTSFLVALGLVVLGLIGAAPAAAQDTSATNEANNPLTPKVTINFHNYYVPSLTDLDDRRANQFLLRGLVPHSAFGAAQLFRFTCPLRPRRNSPTARKPASAT